MVCHLSFPYNWVECVNDDACRSILHLDGSAGDLNDAPQIWLESMHGFVYQTVGWNGDGLDFTEKVLFVDKFGRKHRVDGPAYENSQGEVRWYDQDSLLRVENAGEKHVMEDGSHMWWSAGRFYFCESSAVEERADGSKEWDAVIRPQRDVNSKILGRVKMVEFLNGDVMWVQDGLVNQMVNVRVCDDVDTSCLIGTWWKGHALRVAMMSRKIVVGSVV